MEDRAIMSHNVMNGNSMQSIMGGVQGTAQPYVRAKGSNVHEQMGGYCKGFSTIA